MWLNWALPSCFFPYHYSWKKKMLMTDQNQIHTCWSIFNACLGVDVYSNAEDNYLHMVHLGTKFWTWVHHHIIFLQRWFDPCHIKTENIKKMKEFKHKVQIFFKILYQIYYSTVEITLDTWVWRLELKKVYFNLTKLHLKLDILVRETRNVKIKYLCCFHR